MNHGINNTLLYSACKVSSVFQCNATGKELKLAGTAFFTTNKKGEVCLITNRHMIEINYNRKDDKYKTFNLTALYVDNRRNNPQTGLPTDIVDLKIENLNKIQFSDQYENDIACLINVKIAGAENKEIAFSVPYDFFATDEFIKTKLSVGDFVAFPGFPKWYDVHNNNPILRTGTIASDPRFDYSPDQNYKGASMAYEAFSFGGSSGSPVFAMQKGFPVAGIIQAGPDFYRPIKLIGINAGHLSDLGYAAQHSGISYMYKSSEILAIIDK